MNLVLKKKPFFGPSLFEDFFKDDLFAFDPVQGHNIKVDIKEEADKYILQAEVPGLKADEINIELDKDVLTLSGERKVESETNEKGYIRREISSGSFKRSFKLDRSVEAEGLKANLKNGVLTVDLPFSQLDTVKKISISEVD